ncbi:MAG: hypothetical protein U0X76_10075 [Bacteroidia bacterium]
MQSPIIHQQLIVTIDRIRDLHRSMLTNTKAISPAEMEAFIAEIRKVYELSLQLNYYNALQLLNEIQVTPVQAEIARTSPAPAEQQAPAPKAETTETPARPEIRKEEVPAAPLEVPAPHVHISMEKLMADISNPKNQETPVKKQVTGVHELYEANETLASQFEDHETLADRIATKSTKSTISEKLTRIPVKDLKIAIGLNEKFQFINQLFSGDSGRYNQAIDYLNTCGNGDAAQEYLKHISTEYNWEEHAASATVFVDLIERRYLS